MKFINNKYILSNLILFCLFSNPSHIFANNVGVIGTGYVGLVIGSCLSHLGHNVICTDIDKKKIKMLNKNIVPIFEPGLEELIKEQTRENKLKFTNDLKETIENSEVIFITVGTPTGSSGQADLSFVNNVAQEIANHLKNYKVICVKSTVPIGTVNNIKKIISEKVKKQGRDLMGLDPLEFDVAFNPEFLREGVALNDFLKPERVVLGTDSPRALAKMREIYEPLIQQGIPFISTDIVTAETIKYAANAFLAIKISYINEMSRFCDKIGSDVNMVAKAVGLDSRIGSQFLKPGPGFGGSCFPKDIQALLYMAKQIGSPLGIVEAAFTSNQIQKTNIVRKLERLLSDEVNQKTIAILGLAFKANTDDVRESPAIDIIEELLAKKAYIKAYDPIAINNMKKVIPQIEYCSTIDLAVTNADAVLLLTDWHEFYHIDLQKIYKLLRKPIILDARNILNTKLLKQCGFIFDNIGNAKIE